MAGDGQNSDSGMKLGGKMADRGVAGDECAYTVNALELFKNDASNKVDGSLNDMVILLCVLSGEPLYVTGGIDDKPDMSAAVESEVAKELYI